jgi:hypothetical protein
MVLCSYRVLSLKRATEATKKKEKKKRATEATKKKKKRGSTTIFYSTLVLQKNEHPYFSFESFHVLISITMWGTFHYRTWLAYSKDEPPQKCSRSS